MPSEKLRLFSCFLKRARTSDIILSVLAPLAWGQCADANSVIDVVIMGGNAGHTRAPAADMDGNGEVNVTDLNIVLDLIIKGN